MSQRQGTIVKIVEKAWLGELFGTFFVFMEETTVADRASVVNFYGHTFDSWFCVVTSLTCLVLNLVMFFKANINHE